MSTSPGFAASAPDRAARRDSVARAAERRALRVLPIGGKRSAAAWPFSISTARCSSSIAGCSFPKVTTGVDLILPSSHRGAPEDVEAIVLTHGHEDHIGRFPTSCGSS